MFIHCFFLFPETANKALEEVAGIFEDSSPGSIKYIGTPAWKTRNNRRAALQLEYSIADPEKKPGDTLSSGEVKSKGASEAPAEAQ